MPRPMPIETENGRLPVLPLARGDLDEVFALYSLVLASSPRGALDERDRAEFAALLEDRNTIAVGLRAGSMLVGYAFYILAGELPAPNRAFLDRFGAGGQAAVLSRGIAVHPDYRQSDIGSALIAHQRAILAMRGIEHAFNVVLHANWPAIPLRLRSGGVFPGHITDRYGLCFLAYTGPLTPRFSRNVSAQVEVAHADIAAQEKLFARGFAVTACGERDGVRRLLFAPPV